MLDYPFAADLQRMTFDVRKRELLKKKADGGDLRVELVTPTGQAPRTIGYCITSLTADGRGEVDSMFVVPDCRGHGIGTQLVRRALEWLDHRGARSRSVVVAHGNVHASALYQRLGFVPRSVLLQQPLKDDAAPAP